MYSAQLIVKAFKASLPILFSFLSLGFGFGYIAKTLGVPWHLIIFMAAIIYAGSAEFLVATMLAKGFSFSDITVAAAMVNLRHIFYGISVYRHYPANWCKRIYMIHTLTDETYSILAAKKEANEAFAFLISLFNHFYWVIGVALGVVIGAYSAFKIEGLEFCLTALFIVLAVEQFLAIKKWLPFNLALIAAVIAKAFFPNQLLVMALLIVTLLLMVSHQLSLNNIES